MKLSFVTVFAAAAARELDADNAEARLELIKGHFEVNKLYFIANFNIFLDPQILDSSRW